MIGGREEEVRVQVLSMFQDALLEQCLIMLRRERDKARMRENTHRLRLDTGAMARQLSWLIIRLC